MPYCSEISRSNPAGFIMLLDQSGSMADSFGEGAGTKAAFVADVVNRTLHDIVIRCTKTEEIRDYYHVAIIGYGGSSVRSLLSGPHPDGQLTPISVVADTPARIDTRAKKVPDGVGGLVEQTVRFPVWVEPQAEGGTPMCQALGLARQLVAQWIAEHPNSFPPTVLHLTDGESTDGDPSAIGGEIVSLSTSDGAALMLNCHVSSRASSKIEYPTDGVLLPDNFARTLCGISSRLPETFRNAADSVGIRLSEGARGFVFNGDPTSVVQFFEIGTRPANLR